MSDELEKQIAGTIDDYLLALAEGVSQAQEALSRFTVPGASGQPPVQYQLPRLDFELKMTFSLERETEQDGSSSSTRASRSRSPLHAYAAKGRPLLKALPVNPDTVAESMHSTAVSTIKGSFVTVPINGGKPPNYLELMLTGLNRTEATLGLRYQTAGGEPIENAPIHLGIDRTFSAALNAERGVASGKQTLQSATDFKQGVVVTDKSGVASATLIISEKEDGNASIVVEASLGSLLETLIIQLG